MQQLGLMLGYIALFQSKTPSSVQLQGIFEGENKYFDQGTVLLQGGEDGAREVLPFCALVGSPGATEKASPFQKVSFFSGLSCNR